MSWLASARRRSPAEWGIRTALALVIAWGGYQSVAYSVAVALPGSQLERANALAPGEAQIAASLSARLSGAEASAADRARADAMARSALLKDATAVEAVGTLGINALARNDQQAAQRLFAYSQRLSRRNLQTQLWAIEDAVARDDVPGALRHYDIALRTKPNTQELLFPILGSAIEDQRVRAGLIRTLAQKPLWGNDFVEYVAGNGPQPQATASLLGGLERAGLPVSASAAASVISALLNHGDPDSAWAYYAGRHRGVDRRQSRDPGFTGELNSPSAFDWGATGASGLSASLQRRSAGGVFDFGAPAGVGGVVLQQLQVLPAGEYVLTGHSVGIDQASEALPYWALDCRGGAELGKIVIPKSAEAAGQFSGRFVVPQGCPIQILSFVVRPSNAIAGVSGQIDRALLRPLH